MDEQKKSDMDERIEAQKSYAIQRSLGNFNELLEIYKAEKKRGQEIQIAKDKIHAIISSMSDGMIATDEMSVIVKANPVACHLFEKNPEELIGKRLTNALPLPQLERHLDKAWESADGRASFETAIPKPIQKTLHISISRIHDHQGYVLVIHDVTAQKRAENLKYEFLSILSHELRTPLTGILGFTELLTLHLSDKLDPPYQNYLEMIGYLSKQMVNIVNELLEFARLQSQELDSMDEEIYLDKLIRFTYLQLEEKSSEKNIRLELKLETEHPRVIGNTTLLQQGFYHLVQNAIIFGKHAGRVTVVINKKPGYYQLTFADDGIGIPAGELEKIFNSFYQVEEHDRRNQDGLGLGLSIARRVVQLHRGKITVESRLNYGTTFYVTLPIPNS
ncbi:MAG: hypothetical protein B6244_07195 [Candidatus Cloacimonetes bacterium 4572_55]|nr:MAG: hypothetical protein B6244_07195 [Candidatus Cloacimonetes bacterium 4572_55]